MLLPPLTCLPPALSMGIFPHFLLVIIAEADSAPVREKLQVKLYGQVCLKGRSIGVLIDL